MIPRPGPERGWKAREAAAKAKLAAGMSEQLAENLRNADERFRKERAEAEAFALSQEELRRSTLCGCPACAATGEVTEAESAFIASALAYYRSKNFAADPLYMRKDKLLPRPVRADAPVVPASETVDQKKVKARHTPPPPFLDND